MKGLFKSFVSLVALVLVLEIVSAFLAGVLGLQSLEDDMVTALLLFPLYGFVGCFALAIVVRARVAARTQTSQAPRRGVGVSTPRSSAATSPCERGAPWELPGDSYTQAMRRTVFWGEGDSE